MPVFTREDFHQVLGQIEQGHLASIYLLYGDRYLVKSTLSQLTEKLIPDSIRGTNLEVVDGSEADFRHILDSLNTFALFSGRKAVVVQDCRILYSRGNLPALFGKSEEAYEAGDVEGAARLLLEVLAYTGWTISDVAAGAWKEIPAELWQQTTGRKQTSTSMAWLDEVADHAKSTGMGIPKRGEEGALLESALGRGFPSGQCLILTSDTVDKRLSIYRTIETNGVVADLSVASGSGQRVRSQQEAVLKDLVQETMSIAGKTIEPGALSLLMERTGFNLWALKTQLEKLIAYLGDESVLTRDQVERMSDRFREEPLYELNNAIASTDCGASLLVLKRLLEQNFHPLQLIGSLANEIRRLLMAREFIDSHLERRLDPGLSYGRFKKNLLPQIKAQAGEGSPLATLHPYALHQTMVRSAKFQTADLIKALQHLFEADVVLKSTGLPQRSVMEELVLKLCRIREDAANR